MKKQELGDRLLSLINNVNGMVYRGHRDWSLSVIGAEVEPVTGYTAEEFMSGAVNWKSIIHPDDQGWLKESFRNAVKNQLKSLRVEYRIKHKNGGIRWIADRRQMVYDEIGSFAYVDGLLLDVTERKETDRKLAESEYRFRTIADTAVNGMVTVDSKGNIDFFNRAAERLFGYSSGEVVGRNVTMLLPERLRGAHQAGLKQYRETGDPRIIGKTVELEALRKDGTEFPIELSLGTWGPREEPFFSAIIRDITDRRHWEEALKESEERFRAIFEGSKDGILLADVESKRFITANQSLCNMLGYSLDEIRRLGVADIHPVEDLPRVLHAFERQARQELEVAKDLPVKRKDGSAFYADIKSSPVMISGKQYLIGNFRDATDRRKAEEALIRLGMAVDQAAEAIVVTDTQGKIEYVNPAFERITGHTREEAVGSNMRILKSGKHDEKFYKEMWATLSRGEVWQGRFINRKKDGTLYDEEETISPVRDASGKIVNFVAGKRDITKEVVLRNQVQTAQRMESVGTLAGGIAHDFNNALTGVLGFAELLKKRLAGDPIATADIDQILRSAARASTLTRQLLTFARRQVIEPVNLSMSKVVLDLSKLLRKVIGEHIEVKASLYEDPPSVFADPGQMEQVLMNLCLNARDAMPSGGRLSIRTDVTIVDREYVKSHPYAKEGRYVLLAVSDNGIGMDAKTVERIFEPFFTTKGPEKGTGLGLAVVYGIVKQHNGFIHVSSDPGKGTTFEIRLPAVDAEPAPRAAAKEERARGGNETILLAEDDEPVRTLAERILKECGYRVLSARNGEEAIAVFRENAGGIRLAILDVMMPRKGGKEAFEVMRRTSPALKVIYTSGYTDDTVHDSFVLYTGVPFLQKPFGPGALARKVRDVLDSR
ncbi:MAG: PAS domain S-box protein [bacterium]